MFKCLMSTEELVKQVQLSQNPTDLEIAMCNKLIAFQQKVEKITELVEEDH
jgi:hypothetical protein